MFQEAKNAMERLLYTSVNFGASGVARRGGYMCVASPADKGSLEKMVGEANANVAKYTKNIEVEPITRNEAKGAMKAAAVGGALYAGMNLGHQLIQKAYGAFKDGVYYGVYYCDPNNLDGEKFTYRGLVDSINKYLYTHPNYPNASVEELHKYMWDNGWKELHILEKMKECLASNGINPDSVAQLSPKMVEVLAVPEFGATAAIALGIGAGLGLAYKLGKKKFGNLFYNK